jgi:hypothetical protein
MRLILALAFTAAALRGLIVASTTGQTIACAAVLALMVVAFSIELSRK